MRNKLFKPVTEEQFKAVLPVQVKKLVNRPLMEQINNTLSDPETMEIFRENLLSYTSVMREGRFKLSGYINAVKYISFKLLGDSNMNAYIKTFPDKYQRLTDRGTSRKDIASYAASFNKSKLVNLIFEQTLIPNHVLNAPLYQDAINQQAILMTTAKSEKVRCDAANSLLTHLKPPETKKLELDIGISQGSIIDDYQVAMQKMVAEQQRLIGAGGDIKQIANASIKKVEPEPEIIDVA